MRTWSRNPGAALRARAELLDDPARGNLEVSRAARCAPETVRAARRELEAEGAVPVHACGDPKPPPRAEPGRTRQAVARLGLDATPRQVAGAAGVSVQMAWRALGDERAAAAARAAEAERLAALPRCARCGGPYEPGSHANRRQRFCTRACQLADRADRGRAARPGTAGQPYIPALPPQPVALARGRCVTCPPHLRHLWTSDSRAEREAAQRMCQACPALDGCRQWALALPGYYDSAVYGGMTGTERQAARRAAKSLAS